MSALENAVQTLAQALDSLESKLEDKMSDLVAKDDSIESAARQAATARAFVNTASEDITASIREINALLGENKPATDAAAAEKLREEA